MTPRDEMNAVLDALFAFAEEMIRHEGEFHPFAAAMNAAGKVDSIAGYTGEELPEAQDVISLLEGFLRSAGADGELRAAGICVDVRTETPDGRPTDAACARLSHQAADPIDVFLPYTRNWRRRVEFGELFATEGSLNLFG